MLNDIHTAMVQDNPPDLDGWHSGFKTVVDNIAEEGYRLLPLARHVATNAGLTYPAVNDIDQQYISNLKTPNGSAHYDTIFDSALENVGLIWSEIANTLVGSAPSSQRLVGNWNLDTGMNEKDKLVFWS